LKLRARRARCPEAFFDTALPGLRWLQNGGTYQPILTPLFVVYLAIACSVPVTGMIDELKAAYHITRGG
jgi:hypothetical protein